MDPLRRTAGGLRTRGGSPEPPKRPNRGSRKPCIHADGNIQWTQGGSKLVLLGRGSFRPTHIHAGEVMVTTPAPTREESVRFVPAAPLAPLAHAGRAPPCQGGGTGIVARAVLHSHPRCTRQPRRASNAEDGVRSPADAPHRPAAPSDTLPLCSERRSVARVVRLTSHRLTATMELTTWNLTTEHLGLSVGTGAGLAHRAMRVQLPTGPPSSPRSCGWDRSAAVNRAPQASLVRFQGAGPP